VKRWDGLVEGFLSECGARGLAEATIEHRRRELERWGGWLKRRRPRPSVEGIDSQLAIGYLRRRSAFRSKSTVSSVVSVMRQMGEYLLRGGQWQTNPLRWIRGPRLNARSRLPRRIGRGSLERLWQGAAELRCEHRRYLWMAMLGVLYGTGLRRGELERLKLSDWDSAADLLRVDGRKTGQERIVPISSAVRQCLEAYLPRRQNCLEKWGRLEEPALFVNASGAPVRGPSVGRSLHGLAKRLGVPLVSLHQFRHTCASDLLESGVMLPQVQQILGHAAITSTMRYLDIADPERRKAIERHPVNEMLAAAGG
jgi:site-specific recombinase XerD